MKKSAHFLTNRLLCLGIVIVMTLLTSACTSNSSSINLDNFYDFFTVDAEFENVQWDSHYNSITGTMYDGTADLHIKVTNKKNVSGVTATINIILTNDGDSKDWVDANYLETETITKTITIASSGITDISIPRSTGYGVFSSCTSKKNPPSGSSIKIEVISVDE